jgi:SAM-dependent methyltransferase
MITRLDVPEVLHRNAQDVAEIGYEHTGNALINLATRSAGLKNLMNTDVLDVGCGVRFTMTIINRKIPIKSYTGIEVHRPIVDFLQANVEAYDGRFRFPYWNVHNQMYNPEGVELSSQEKLPLDGTFDLIWLFSVFTHMNPKDSLAMLQILRKHIRTNGKLFFSAFIDDDLDGFEDRIKEHPLWYPCYGRKYMQSLVEQAGWLIETFHDKDPDNYIQHYFVCSPNCNR